MASEIGIGAAQRGCILGEPPSDHETGDGRRAGTQSGCRSAGLNATGGIQEAARVSFRWPEDHRRKARRTVETSGIIDNPPDIVFQVQRVSPDKLAVTAQLPARSNGRSSLPRTRSCAPP